jgi:hypothetical protein
MYRLLEVQVLHASVIRKGPTRFPHGLENSKSNPATGNLDLLPLLWPPPSSSALRIAWRLYDQRTLDGRMGSGDSMSVAGLIFSLCLQLKIWHCFWNPTLCASDGSDRQKFTLWLAASSHPSQFALPPLSAFSSQVLIRCLAIADYRYWYMSHLLLSYLPPFRSE